MKSPYSAFDRFTFWLAGTDNDAVQTGCLSDNDISEQRNFGYAVAIGTVVAFVVSLLLFKLVLTGIQKPVSYAYVASFVWAAFVCYTDRMLFKKRGAQLYFRIGMLAFNALIMSIGYQVYEADAQIEEYIKREAGESNKTIFEERDTKRKIYTTEIDNLHTRINEIWADPDIKYKTRMTKPLEAMVKEREAELKKFDDDQKALLDNLIVKPDLSFSRKAKVFWQNFLFDSFFGVLVSLLVMFMEGLPMGLRLANHQSDYLAFMRARSRIPMGQWRKLTAAQKVQFYLQVQKENEQLSNEDLEFDSNSNHNGNGKAAPEEDLFPPFTFKS
jgi:hypothetical protein